MKVKEIHEEVEFPEGVEFTYADGMMKAKGPKGESQRKLLDPKVKIGVKDNKVIFDSSNSSKREKAKIGTFRAHVRNMVHGVTEGFVYKLKVCSGHFPMNVSVGDAEITIKNFLGEKVPRKVKIKEGAKVNLDGAEITIESTNKEVAGQVAADIEQLCRVTNKDRRIFQDGIYIVEKAGKRII